MAWSRNVALEALGHDHAELKKQEAVTVLMTDDVSEGAPDVAGGGANGARRP